MLIYSIYSQADDNKHRPEACFIYRKEFLCPFTAYLIKQNLTMML